ncbi:hypothetical protein B0H10DRAFT_2074439, partial [Mycena sp. CBHHK59/15]
TIAANGGPHNPTIYTWATTFVMCWAMFVTKLPALFRSCQPGSLCDVMATAMTTSYIPLVLLLPHSWRSSPTSLLDPYRVPAFVALAGQDAHLLIYDSHDLRLTTFTTLMSASNAPGLGPFPFASSITIVVSPAISSPHVHFPASPVLTAVFSTHSPNSYDRSATIVAPNPLELPGWGQRVYSPGQEAFSSIKSPAVSVPLVFIDAPPLAVTSEMDSAASKVVRFGSSRSVELGKSLTLYPRSPYPSAPTSPMSRDKENTEVARVARAKSLDSPKTKRAPKRPASLKVSAGRPATPRVSSPLANANTFLSPVEESPSTATAARPGAAEADARLNHEFWRSVSLENADGLHAALRFPPFVFSTRDGLLWSPGLPKKEHAALWRFLAPQTGRRLRKFDRSMVTSPGDQPLAYPSIDL